MNYIRFLKYAKWGLEKEISELQENIKNNKKHTERSNINYTLNRLLEEYKKDLKKIDKFLEDENIFVDIIEASDK